MILKATGPIVFNRIRLHDASKGAWDALKRLHGGNSNIYASNLTVLKINMDLFAMKNGESPDIIFTRLSDPALLP
jgi:hypothetical protein